MMMSFASSTARAAAATPSVVGGPRRSKELPAAKSLFNGYLSSVGLPAVDEFVPTDVEVVPRHHPNDNVLLLARPVL